MPYHQSFIVCLLLFVSTILAFGTPTESKRYVRLYEQIFTQQEPAVAKMHAPEKLWLSSVAVRLAQQTGRPEYQDKAVTLFESALPEVAAVPSDFHSQRGIALVILPMRQLGLVKPEHVQALRPLALRTWKEFLAARDGTPEGDADNNIRLAQALGCAAFVSFFKDDRTLDVSPIRKRLEQYWAKIKATGDLDEDASNYTGLGMIHCIELARTLGHEQDLSAPGFRRMFERMRDLISTTGLAPEFGDGFFTPEPASFDFLYLCEYAAKLYNDPTFLTVARRLYDPASFAMMKPDGWGRAISLLDLDVSTAAPAPLPAASLVNYRVNRESPRPVVDKLILRTGNEPGDAMVFMDLYSAGSHAHRFLGPSIGYYEVDGVPLFHNLGRRRTSSAITGNSFWALPESQSFPGVWKPDEWFTMTIPAEMMLRDETGALKTGDRVFFRNFENRGTLRLWFDNLRLEGRAGVRLLDGFESEKGWDSKLIKDAAVKLETSPEHTQGNASQSLNWGALKTSCTRKLADAGALTFQADTYDSIKLDVKYTGIRPYFHLRELCQQMDIGDHALINTVASARAEQRGCDAFGEVLFSRYIASDAQLTRRMVLTAEGSLVIHDRWSPGKSQAKWNAGQLWQFYALKEKGPDWVCGDDDGVFTVPDGHGGSKSVARRMVVKFAGGPDAGVFSEEILQACLAPNFKNRPQDRFFTTGSRRAVAAEGEASFTLVVVPHDPVRDAKSVAEAISLHERPDGADVVIEQPAGAPVRVALFRDGRWEVSRKP